MLVIPTQALSVGDRDGRTSDAGPEHAPRTGTAAHSGLGVPCAMGSTAARTTPIAPQLVIARPSAVRRRGSSSVHPEWGQVFDEGALLGAPAFFGPPVIWVLCPWVLLVLLLIGPFALILTAMLVLAVAVGLLAVFAAVMASPYLLVRHLHARGTFHAEPRAPSHSFAKPWVSSAWLGSSQPKGVS